MKYQLPDYDNCCVNLISSVAKKFGINTHHKTLKVVDQALKKEYRNVVVLLLDGFGKELFNRRCDKNGFFAKHFVQDLSAVYPSSTTPATVSFKCGYTPIEHGWWAQFLYFKEVGAAVNLYLNTDAYSHAETGLRHIAHDIMPYTTIHERIYQKHKDSVKCYAICPTKCRDVDGIPQMTYDGYSEMAELVQSVCHTEGKHYVYAYYDYPDKAEHKYGPYSRQVADILSEIEAITEVMCNNCPDTLFLISADHGQTPVNEVRDLSQFTDLYDCLSMAPTGGNRTTSVRIKQGRQAEFKRLFKKYLSDKFVLFSQRQVLDMGLFGNGTQHPKIDDTLGDFLIIPTSDCSINTRTMFNLPFILPLGGHGGLTYEEMTVPLCMYGDKL